MAAAMLLCAQALGADTVRVRHTEGVVHGFLALRTLDGAPIANGDLIQDAVGARVTSRLLFRFKDGSLHDEEAVFSQRGQFHLLRDHLVQKGPSFPHPLDMVIDATNDTVRVQYEDDGTLKTETAHLQLPPDLANGLVLTLLKNVRPGPPPASLSFVAATPSPRLVKLAVSAAGDDRFVTGSAPRSATHYVLKVDLGGVQGVLARLLGKQPPDAHVWILHGDAPAFVKAEQSLYVGGPVWRIELVSPDFTAP